MILRKQTVQICRWVVLIALPILLLLSTLMSCNGNEQDSPQKTAVPVQFLSQLVASQLHSNPGAPPRGRSRASDDSWDMGDEVGIYMTPHAEDGDGSQGIDVDHAINANVPYTASESSTSSALVPVDGSIFFPLDDSAVNFMAYYPYNDAVHSTHNHVYPVDVTTQAPLAAIDLLYHGSTTACSVSGSRDGVPLVFSHQLSKLSISVVDASGDDIDLLTATASLVGVPTTAGFHLATGVLNTPGGTDTAIAPVMNTELSTPSQALFESIFVPHNGGADTERTITITIDGTAYSHPMPAERSFLAGTAYSYNFKFTGSGLVLTQVTVVDWDSGIIFWGESQLTTTRTYFDLPFTTSVATANTVIFSTTAASAPVLSLSTESGSVTTDKPTWITDATLTSTGEADGWHSYTLTFGTNIHIGSAGRTGYIHIDIEGLTLAVRVTQANAELYVNDPNPAAFNNIRAAGNTGNLFAIKTNAQDASITVSSNNEALIPGASLTTNRSSVSSDGSSTWDIRFDVTENTTTSVRQGVITVVIGGITKTINVSQVAVYVNNIVPPTTIVVSADAASKSFTFETNSTAGSLTSLTTNNSTLISGLSATRDVKDETNGIYKWTVTFNVSRNSSFTTTRSGTISFTIGGISRTVSVQQKAAEVTQQPYTYVTDGMSNCYIVNTNSSVAFKVSRAYTYSGSAFTTTLHVGGTYTGSFVCKTIWDDNSVLSGTTSGSDVLHTVHGSGNAAVIVVETSGSQGNAVVGLYKADGTTLLWSYHIWVLASYNPENTNYTNNGFKFMDRNLGATAAANSLAGRGLLYQWGRKDPFPGLKSGTAGYSALSRFTGCSGNAKGINVSSNAAGIVKSIQNPTELYGYTGFYEDWLPSGDASLWGHGSNKSIYDPCPPGWRVPAPSNSTTGSSPWYRFKNVAFSSGDDAGAIWQTSGGNMVFPASGYYGLKSLYVGERGYYWTALTVSNKASTGCVDSALSIEKQVSKSFGLSVRCVSETYF